LAARGDCARGPIFISKEVAMRPVIAVVVGLWLGTFGSGIGFAANPEPLDIDAELAAKVAKEKSKAKVSNTAKSAKPDAKTTATGDCSINIGNVDASKTGKGVGSVVPAKSTTVVITGPVVNVGNKCK
jgi:hypothetical protein